MDQMDTLTPTLSLKGEGVAKRITAVKYDRAIPFRG
jgi:hypothetical protein